MAASDPSPPASAKGAALYLGVAQVARLALTTLSTIVLSRLLTPDDFGVIAMTAPVVALIWMFQDLGLSAAAVQRETLAPEESVALFWVNMAASLSLALVLLLLAPGVALFYGEPRAGYVTAASGATVLVTGLTLQHAALLNRSMRFAALSIAEVANAAVALAAAAIAALLLRSYWALVIGSLAGALTQALLLWRAVRLRPGWRPRFAAARSMLRFGGDVTGFNLVNFFVRNADNVLIARFAGSSAIGLYDRSYKLMMLPIQNINAPLNRLLLPLLSRARGEPERYRRSFLLSARAVMLASAPGVAVATVLSDQLMPFLLGRQWAGAGPIFFWLGLTGLVQPIANLTGVLFMSSGNTRTMVRLGLWSALLTLAGFGLGLWWGGAVGVAASLFVTAIVRLPVIFALAVRGTSLGARDLWEVQLEPLLGAGVGAALAWALAPHWSILANLALSLPLAYLAAFATSSVSPRGRAASTQLWSIARGALHGAAARLRPAIARGAR